VSKGWPLVPMEDIFAIARGGSPRPIDSFLTDDPDGVNWVMISDATESGKYINSTKKRIREEGVKRSRVVQPGDFLLTNSMSFGRPYIMNTSGCIHDGWLVLSPRNQNVSPDFFYHLLGSDFVYAEFVRRAAGATVKNLNIDLVKGVQVPLPPMPEQRRIAEVLDRAEALRAKRRAALAQLDTLTQSIFFDLFGDPTTNPKGWPVRELQEIVQQGTIVTYGIVQAGKEYPSGIPYIRTGDIVDGEVEQHGLRHTDPAIAARFARSRVEAGEIVMSIRATVGTTAVVPPELDGANLTQGTARIAPGGRVDRTYLLYYLRASGTQHWIALQIKGATFREITLGRLRELPVQVPPMSSQCEFSRRAAIVEKLKTAYRASLVELNTLFAVLQHRAFRGEL
jgi:type I restriction enzyme, S subunit